MDFLMRDDFRKAIIGTKIIYHRCREYTGYVMENIPYGFKIGETVDGPIMHKIQWDQVKKFEEHINVLLTDEEIFLIKKGLDDFIESEILAVKAAFKDFGMDYED